MTKTEIASQCDVDALLGQAVDDYLQALADGKRPTVDEYARMYPDIEDLILRTLPALELIQDAESEGPKLDGLDLSKSQQLGDFRMLRQLGSGGMGLVYEAEQLSIGRRVALKILPLANTLHKQALQRFRNEVRAAAMLDHPNIVSVYSVGEERGVHYYSMQLICGQSLADVIRELTKGEDRDALSGDAISAVVSKTGRPNPSNGTESLGIARKSDGDLDTADAETDLDLQARISTLPKSETRAGFFRSAAELGVQVANALQHAHEQGVFHRDIKPGNLMLDANAKPYITDFGLARIEADAAITRTGDLLGTLRYMSPEQALADAAVSDGRSDIYSLGVTLYELLCLRPLFDSQDRHQLLQQIAFEEPAKLRKLDPAIPRELETIVHKAIEKNPDERYQSAGELAADLQAFLDDRTIQAKPPSLSDKLSKWSRRHRPLVWTMAISACVVLVTAISTLTFSNLVIAQERRAAEHQAATANAVIDFITDDLLGAASPLNEPDRDIRLRTVVDRAATRIDDKLADQPLVAAAIRTTLGETYRALGEFTTAEEHLRDALQTYVTQLGVDHRTTQECQRKLAHVLLEQGRDVQAEQLFRAVFDARLEELGDQHFDTLQSMSDLGELSLYCGQHGSARLLFEHVVNERRKQLGEEHPLALEAQHRLAEATSRLDSRGDNVQEAEKLFRQVLIHREKLLGPEHPYTLETRHFLAAMLLRQTKLEQAESEFRGLLKTAGETLGAKHPFTIRCQTNLANTRKQQGSFDEAHQLYSTALALANENTGEGHPLTLEIQLGLAANFAAQAKDQQALPLFEKLIQSLRRTLGEQHPLTHSAKLELLSSYERQGLDGKAAELRERIDSPQELAEAMSESWFWGQPLSFRARRERDKAERMEEQKSLGGKRVPGVLNGLDATLLNGTRVVEGKFGRALLFDGQDDRANIEDRPELAFTESMTIQCWLRIDSFPQPESGHGTIVMRSDHRGGRDPYYLITKPSGELEFGIDSLEEKAAIAATPADEFIHVAATLDDSTGEMRLYFDGRQVAQLQTDVRPFADLKLDRQAGIGVGNHFGIRGHNFPFHGVIERLTIVDSALQPEEISQLADEGPKR